MTISLVFDTETTGKWDFKAPPTAEHQPRMVQLAFELYDDDRILQTFSSFVIPAVPIPDEAAKVHGISEQDAREYGVKAETAIGMFKRALARADRIVAHNLDFDLKVIGREFWIGGTSEPIPLKNPVCTMKTATPVVAIPSPYKPGSFKWPSLQESYKFLVDPKGFSGAHDALVDVRACFGVLRALEKREVALVDHRAQV